MDAEHEELVEQLAETPMWLRAAVSADRGADSPAGEWGIAEAIRHVRAADAILSTRVFQILVREAAPLPAFDERAWGELLAAAGMPLADQIAGFALRRAELVAVLRSLTPVQWQRTGQHEMAGAMTVADVCRMIVAHETEHRAQLDAMRAN